MIGIISSIIIAIGVLVMTLITFNPNARMIMESDFMRTAKNNAYLYAWELAQLNVRTGNLTVDAGNNKKNIALGYLSDKVIPPSTSPVIQQDLKADISYINAPSGTEDYLEIQVDK
jgi:hypothetical protein